MIYPCNLHQNLLLTETFGLLARKKLILNTHFDKLPKCKEEENALDQTNIKSASKKWHGNIEMVDGHDIITNWTWGVLMKINIMTCRSEKSNFKPVVYLYEYGHYQYNISFM